ncbi:MAG: hypothetical protein AAGI90_05405 [Chlamydiota bacterium]
MYKNFATNAKNTISRCSLLLPKNSDAPHYFSLQVIDYQGIRQIRRNPISQSIQETMREIFPPFFTDKNSYIV